MTTDRGDKPAEPGPHDSAVRHPSALQEDVMDGLSTTEIATPHVHEAARNLVLRRGIDGRLMAVNAAGAPVAVRLRQCFPWSEPQRHISLRDEDDVEIALIEDPTSLDVESRQALEEALADAGFVLEVTRVIDIDEEVEIRHWTVDTKQGHRTFQTHLDDWPRVLPSGGRLIRDVGGDLYHLADPARMDKKSRDLLWAFID
ncbi:MAG TPA: DUF1854 domain-containing protein [Gemmatimonadaceae bacterium]|nr:DUF1854 domain-containing protein [Gemmatimonadaceae bacterium]